MTQSLLKICVIGNCQAQSIQAWLSIDGAAIEILHAPPVWLIQENQYPDLSAKLNAADLIFCQALSHDFSVEMLRPQNLKSQYGSRVKIWPNIYFDGYFPGIGYRYRHDGSKISGPLDDYHFDFIEDCYRKGLSVEKAERAVDTDALFTYHPDPINASLGRLAEREVEMDLIISDFLAFNLGSPQMMFAMNHPSNAVLREMMERMLASAGEIARLHQYTPFPYTLDKIIIPAFKPVTERNKNPTAWTPGNFKGIELKDDNGRYQPTEIMTHYSTKTLVESFYRIYSREYDPR